MPTYEELEDSVLNIAGLDARTRDLVQEYLEAEWRGYRTTDNHVRLLAPDGTSAHTLSGTPSDSRSIPNARAELRKWKRMQADNPSDGFTCKECGETFPTKQKLANHAAGHRTLYCPACAVTFRGNQGAAFGAHKRNEHGIVTEKWKKHSKKWQKPDEPKATVKEAPVEPPAKPVTVPSGAHPLFTESEQTLVSIRQLVAPDLLAELEQARKERDDALAKLNLMREVFDA